MTWWEGLAAGAAALAGGMLLARRVAVGTAWLLLAVAVMVPLAVSDGPRNSLGFTAFLLLAGPGIHHLGILAVLAGYSWPMAPPLRGARTVLGAVLGATVLLGAVAPVVFFDPVSAGCNACARNLLEIVPLPGISETLQRLSTLLTVVSAPALAVLTGAAWVRATRLGRRQGLAILVGTVGMATVTTAAAWHALQLPIAALDDAERGLWVAQCAILVVLAGGVIAQRLVSQAAAARMAGRVIAAIPDPQTVQAWMRDSRSSWSPTWASSRAPGCRSRG
jgi:hypothetical protein